MAMIGLLCASKHTFYRPASTILPDVKLPFGPSLGTHRLSLPAFWMTSPLMVGLKSENPSDFAPAARSLLSVLYRPVASVIWYKTHLLASLEDLFPSVVL